MNNQKKALLVALAVAGVSISGPMVKWSLSCGASPVMVAFGRMAISFLLLLIPALRSGELQAILRAPKKQVALACAAGLLLAAAGLLGGTVQALSGAAGSRTIGLWLGAAAAPLLSAATVRLRRMRQGATHVRVRMTCGGRTAAFTAMVDSGNCLRDYLTHRPVIVMPQARGYRLFGLENMPLRPIFADTAGGRQMMLCLTPEATILDNGQTKRAVEALLALSPGLGGNAPALLPVSLLEDGQEGV